MRRINRYPIYPSPACQVSLPAGAQLLGVSLNAQTYYLHALVNNAAQTSESRRISAYLDDTNIPDGDPGTYIGKCPKVGDFRYWHFFDRRVAGDAL